MTSRHGQKSAFTWYEQNEALGFGTKTRQPSHKQVTTKEFAPRAWGAICELLGGEERIYPGTRYWKDALIVNLGSPEWENKEHNPKDLRGWHVDGEWSLIILLLMFICCVEWLASLWTGSEISIISQQNVLFEYELSHLC